MYDYRTFCKAFNDSVEEMAVNSFYRTFSNLAKRCISRWFTTEAKINGTVLTCCFVILVTCHTINEPDTTTLLPMVGHLCDACIVV